MIIVNINEARTNLTTLLALVELQQETVRICRHDKVIAQLLPMGGNDIDMVTLLELESVDSI